VKRKSFRRLSSQRLIINTWRSVIRLAQGETAYLETITLDVALPATAADRHPDEDAPPRHRRRQATAIVALKLSSVA
jgi:hypothetical protein